MSKLSSPYEIVEHLRYAMENGQFGDAEQIIRTYRKTLLLAAADVAYEHCLWMDRHAVGDKILKVGEN